MQVPAAPAAPVCACAPRACGGAVQGVSRPERQAWGDGMGIDRESDIAADLQIGPTTLGMVRIHVAGGGAELTLDFEPDEAEEIAEELRGAAARARAAAAAPAPRPDRGRPPRGRR